ncbi:MAG: RNA 3'-terminal phosphate cyclase [Candidatus Micrarchaeota archaeon]
MIEIDGSYGEGGGQIIRTSLTLSAITQKPVRITNIRANRPNPGLQPQHLMACRSVRNVCRGTLYGAEPGSRELSFEPGPIIGGKYEFDIGTAGSVTLVAQTLLPILLGAGKDSELRITGGTHVMKSPGYDYFENVFIPAIRRFGADAECRMLKTGFYPRGGGVIEVKISPSQLHGNMLWPHEDETQVMIRLSGLPPAIAVREKKIFVQNGIERIRVRQDESLSVGNAVTAWRGCRGAYTLGEKGKRAEIVTQEACDALKAEGKDVDMHLADQLLLYSVLAKGPTSYGTSVISEHLRTNAYVISRFLDRPVRLSDGYVAVD